MVILQRMIPEERHGDLCCKDHVAACGEVELVAALYELGLCSELGIDLTAGLLFRSFGHYTDKKGYLFTLSG